MKNSNFIKNSIIALLPISLGLAVLFGIPAIKSEEVFGYVESSLPTTIDLNDTSSSIIRSYYSNADGKNGNNLLIELKKIISNDQKYYAYDSSNKIWQIYEIADRDWELSPASETTYGTYDSKTNKITNYVYGSNSDGKNNPYLHALYVNRDATNLKRAWGDHGNRNSEATIEREHIWPKSHGFDTGTAAGARGDPMHLWAADGTANGEHSNNFYGYVDKTKSYKDSGTKFSSLSGNLSGFSKTLGGTQTIFEPQDSDKGDIARACFYMAARYNNLAGDAEFIDGSEPNLCLIDDLSKNSETGQSTKTKAYGLGILQDLLEWNKLDPVDEYERHRNDLLYTNFTNNRNPFIDFPQWADIIWGDKTGTASPATDPINNGQSEPTCTGIEITTKPSKLSYKIGETIVLTGMVVTAHYSDGHSYIVTDYTYSPSGALKKTDKELVVTYEGKTASCSISVTGESGEIPDATVLTSEEMGLITDYDDGLNTDLNVKWVYLRKGTNDVIQGTGANSSLLYNLESNGFAIDKIKFNVSDPAAYSNNAKINVCFGDKQQPTANPIQVGGGDDARLATKNSSFTITNPGDGEYFWIAYKTNAVYFSSIEVSYKKVTAVPVESVSLNSNSLNFEIGDRIKLVASILPENATNKNVTWSSTNSGVASVDEEGNVVAVGAGNATISVITEDGSKTAECSVQVAEPIVETGISIDPSSNQKLDFFVGEEFTSEGLKVNLNYSDDSKEDITDNCEISTPNLQTAGQKDVNISYGTFSTSYKITVTNQNLVVFNIPNMGFANGQEIGKQTDATSSFNFICSKEVGSSNAPKYYTSGSSARFYNKNSLTICGPYKVVEVKLVFDSSDPSDNLITVSSGSYVDQKGGTGIWTGSDDFVKFSFGGESNHRRVSKIYIKYDSQSTSNLLSSIELSGNYKTSYYVGESFSSAGLVTTAKYIDQTSKTITPSFSGFDSSTAGEKTITVSFTEKGKTVTTSYKITVSDYALTSLVVGGEVKNEFFVGDEFSHEGLVATAYYEDESHRDVTNSEFLSFDEPDLTTAGNKDVNVYYTENNVTKSDSYSITVYNIEPDSLEITSEPTKLSYFVGDTFCAEGIAATVTYNNGDTIDINENNLEFSNFDMSKAGTYSVKAKYNEGPVSVYDNFEITVSKIEISSISVKTGPAKTVYYTGQNFDSTGLSIEVTYNNGDKKTITSGFTCSGFDSSKPNSSLPITVSYTEDNVTKQTTFSVEVVQLEFESLTLSGSFKTSFLYDTDFSSTGLKATLTYNSGETKDVSNSVTISGYNMKQIGEQTVTVSYKDGGNTISASYKITVNAITPKSLALSGSYKTSFEYGEEFTSQGLVVKATYDNGKTYTVTPTSITGYDKNILGEQTITVSYKENNATVQATYKVNVCEVLQSITLSGNYQTEFIQGDEFTSEGLIVTAHYSGGTTKVVTPTSISGYNNSVLGEHTVTVSYTEDGITVKAFYDTKVTKKVEPTPKPEPKDNKVVIIAAAAGGAVVAGAAIIGISVGVHKKHKRSGK